MSWLDVVLCRDFVKVVNSINYEVNSINSVNYLNYVTFVNVVIVVTNIKKYVKVVCVVVGGHGWSHYDIMLRWFGIF